MFNFYCDLCHQHQETTRHKFSIESFKYFTEITGAMNFDHTHVCGECMDSIEQHMQQLRKEQEK
jgi:hypothetical protein